MTDIAVLACNRHRLTKICLEEIIMRTVSYCRLVVCDNGSSDGTDEVVISMYKNHLINEIILMSENTGVHWGHNTLLDSVQSELYVSTDADLVPMVPDDKDWLEKLVDLMHDYPDYGAIACLPHAMIGDNPKKWEHDGRIAERRWVGAHLRIMRTDLVKQVGGWQKHKRPSRNDEERWICSKITEAGYKVGYAMNVRCIHLFGSEEHGEDPWGYPEEMTPEEHGHREIWPPPNYSSWERLGVDWETCQ